MPTTSNFGWTTPADTDLVKDGAAAIRTLGNGIDTSLVDLKGGTTGQYLVKQSNTDLDFTWTTNTADIDGITATSPLTGGGTSGTITVGIQDGTTAQKGAVQLTDSISSTSTTTAATPNSVKTAYDLANGAIAKSLVDAKADLITATADNTPARLAVGNNGETLVADSSTSTGLRWQGLFAAGKNKIINGDFNINQRNASSTTQSDAYIFDRWLQQYGGAVASVTYSTQNFTLGTAPVAGYEGKSFARQVTTSQTNAGDYAYLVQRIESVRTLANQTVVVSFWAKAASGTPKVSVEFTQYFGTGGSPSSVVRNYIGQVTLSTSWTRYSVSASIASISGKTIGTNNDDWLGLYLWTSAGTDFNSRTNSMGIQNNTFDFWGVQVEQGSVATPFQTATGTLAGELSLCQRYYERLTADTAYGLFGFAITYATTAAIVNIPFKVIKRTTPTVIDTSAASGFQFDDGVTAYTPTTIAISGAYNNTNYGSVTVSGTSGMTQYRPCVLVAKNSSTSYIGFSAEL